MLEGGHFSVHTVNFKPITMDQSFETEILIRNLYPEIKQHFHRLTQQAHCNVHVVSSLLPIRWLKAFFLFSNFEFQN